MKSFKGKKGISLIVLVITIIVMIILAAAIILSLNNSGIIGKANKAKQDSDTANLKEYINVLEAEWELMTEGEKNGETKIAYVNRNLYDKGYKGALLMEDGTLYTNLQANAREALQGGIQIGERVNYSVTQKSRTSKQDKNGKEDQTISNNENFVWRYIGIGDNGELLIAPDLEVTGSGETISTLKLQGKVAYLEGPGELDRLCKELYSTDKGNARSMNIKDVENLLEYKDETEKLTVEQEMKRQGITSLVRGTETPDGKSDIYAYKLDRKGMTASEAPDETRKELVFQPTHYWLASTCVSFSAPDAPMYVWVQFDIYNVYSEVINENLTSVVDAGYLFNSEGQNGNGLVIHNACALRPVVALTANITRGTDTNGVIWTF